jgi:hypothetical protein
MSKTNQKISKTILTQFGELRTIIETSRNQTCRFVNEQFWTITVNTAQQSR